MPHTFTGEQTLMRIFIGEADRCRSGPGKGKPLYEALLEYFRRHDFAGATVIRGIAGFGAHSRIHTDRILRLSLDLPLIVEVVAAEERLQAAMPDLDTMIDGGLITLERARVIIYRPHDAKDEERWKHRVEGLQPAENDAP
jgi:PII-like signaling protein